MGLEGVAEEEPMRSPSPAAAEVEMKKEEEGSETPRSSIYRLKSALTCPAAPRKPQARSKRKARRPQGFFPVPWDLGSVFFPVPWDRLRSRREFEQGDGHRFRLLISRLSLSSSPVVGRTKSTFFPFLLLNSIYDD
ncbi:unnamed protein product [Spirodela intermedia]|uniref:Uncharacterized protein n=1 Tax=Spirodela intermedia TaxID=51605 RepID=A0A7I8LH17_SPIIN|nr:unnamed protein product [Spirodela intermedia]